MPADTRLDPVRWRGPRRVTVLRVVAVAVLLAVAALYAWAGTLPADSSSDASAGPSVSGQNPRTASPGPSVAAQNPHAASPCMPTSGRNPSAASPGPSTSGRNPSPADGRPDAGTQVPPEGGPLNAPGEAASCDSRPNSPPDLTPGDGGADAPAQAGPDDERPDVPPGHVGLPVRLADPTALALVRPGDRVTLLRLDNDNATKVADDAVILAVTGADDPLTGGLLVALKPTVAVRAASGGDRGYAVLLRPD
jgi:hypothetical protein